MSQKSNRNIETWKIAVSLENIILTAKGVSGVTLYIQWKCGKESGILPRSICVDGKASLGEFSFEEKIRRDIKKYRYLKKTLHITLIQVLKNKKQAVGTIELNLALHLENQNKEEVELPIANGRLKFDLEILTDATPMTIKDTVINFDDIVDEIQQLEDDINEQNIEKEKLINDIDDLTYQVQVLKRNRVEEGDVTLEENQFIVEEMFLSKMTFSDKQHPLTGDIIFDKLSENKAIRPEKQKFLNKIVQSLKSISIISLETPKRNIYWIGVNALLVKRINTEIISKNLSDKNVHTRFVNNLFKQLNNSLLMTYQYIENKSQLMIMKYFTEPQSNLGTKVTFEILKEYLASMKKDKLSPVIVSNFCKMFVVHYDRLVFNNLMKQKSIAAEITFYIKCQIAAFCELLRDYSNDNYEEDFILLKSLCDLAVVSLEVISAQDLVNSICPNISFNQIFTIISKIEPPVNIVALNRLKKEVTNIKDKPQASTDENELIQLQLNDIFSF
ncbi:hypothetical protein EDI_138610 [Entamoeba dispar SAW760]|uniref:Dilute domain-containing protein n=1 Tax=Entamoeba dispar (strain ATCC PRA-260 / SAW760) TaxID=370354 RepID=B0EIF4_ENTDS|nr:uncharacterized protein EDI_138610 [Entamoeba dispar SAW760]EDR25683.1 hypothetical protein EDI_138610 [Entamoeba dispar SAW760]|eukprot:EDR25683.1 hypothetical protein EDI_138610 [Entamoeba dispar SAW760]